MMNAADRLKEALANGRLDAAEKLLSAGMFQHHERLFSPSELAAFDDRVLRLLVIHGCDMSEWLRESPRAATEALFRTGQMDAPCAMVEGHREPAVILAVASGHDKLLRALMERGADPNQPDHRGCTALCIAIHMRQAALVEPLLDAGAALKLFRWLGADQETGRDARRMPDKFTALSLASWLPHGAEVVKLLLRVVEDPNELDGRGFSALHCAVEQDNRSAARVLLDDARVDPNVLDRNGKRPYDLHRAVGYVEMLMQAGSAMPAGYRTRAQLSMWALREAVSMRGVVFPFGFGPGENLAHADLRDVDLSRATLTPEQLARPAISRRHPPNWPTRVPASIDGALLPPMVDVADPVWGLEDIGPERVARSLPGSPTRLPGGNRYRYLRAARERVVYRRVDQLGCIGQSERLRSCDLSSLSAAEVAPRLMGIKRFEAVRFPRDLDLSAFDEAFYAEREFIACDFSETINWPAYAWRAKLMRAPKCPPGVDFQIADFRGVDLTDADFSLQVSEVGRVRSAMLPRSVLDALDNEGGLEWLQSIV